MFILENEFGYPSIETTLMAREIFEPDYLPYRQEKQM